jgi:hypothetical protein
LKVESFSQLTVLTAHSSQLTAHSSQLTAHKELTQQSQLTDQVLWGFHLCVLTFTQLAITVTDLRSQMAY